MSDKSPPHSDREDSVSDIDSNEEVARLGMLKIASSSDEAPEDFIKDPPLPPQKHSLVSGPVTRSQSQSKHTPKSRTNSASPRRPQTKFNFVPSRSASKIPRASNPVTRRLLMEDELQASTSITPTGRQLPQPAFPVDSTVSLPGASNLTPDSLSPAGSSLIHVTPPMLDSSDLLSTDNSGSRVFCDPKNVEISPLIAESHRLENLWQLEKKQKEAERKSNESMRAIIQIKDRDIEEQQLNHTLREDEHKQERIDLEKQLIALRLELHSTNARIHKEAKVAKKAVARKDEELRGLYNHTHWQEESAEKATKEFQDVALEHRREQKLLKTQLDQSKKEAAILARMNKHLAGEKDEIAAQARQTASDLDAQKELKECLLDEQNQEFQLEKSVMASESQDTIDQIEAAMSTQDELRTEQFQEMFDEHKRQEAIMHKKFQAQIAGLKSDLIIAKATGPPHSLAAAGGAGDGDTAPSTSDSSAPPAYTPIKSGKRDSQEGMSGGPMRKRRNTNEYMHDMLAVMPASGTYQKHQDLKRQGNEDLSPANPNIRNTTDRHYGMPSGPVDSRDDYLRHPPTYQQMDDTHDQIRSSQATTSQDLRMPPTDSGNQQPQHQAPPMNTNNPACPYPNMEYRNPQHRFQETSTSYDHTPTSYQGSAK